MPVVYVALGGALGASCRFLISQWLAAWLGRGFPFATLVVNILGSFLLGLLLAAIERELLLDIPWRTLAGIGFLGAFTTFSTFSVDTLLLLQQGHTIRALANVGLNLGLCLLAAWAGMAIMGKA